MKKLIGVKTKDKIFISIFDKDSYIKYNSPNYLIIDNEKPKDTFMKNWCVIDKIPEKIQKSVSQPNINHRYELKDKSLVIDKIPLIIKKEDCIVDGEWKEEYSTYQSLYEYKSDKQPDVIKNEEIVFEIVAEIIEIKEFPNFKYKVYKSQWTHEGTRVLDEKEIDYQMIDKLIYPEIVLTQKPCSFSNKKSFDIIRLFVKENINPKVAEITSDYDFCFTVKKKIPLREVETFEVDVNNSWFQKRKRKPKIETRYLRHRSVTCFEMAPKHYQKYPVIQGFKGKNHGDLQNNINDYCKQLIEFINEPLQECSHCKGEGVIITSYTVEKVKE